MRYDLDDMYGILNEYREQDEKHVIQKQEKASHEKNAVLESHLTEKSVPANKMSDQQENPIVEERCYQENDYEAVIPAGEKSVHKKSTAGARCVADADFGKNTNKKSSVVETCALRDIPKCLVEMAKKCFPHTPNYIAVAAFLFAHRDKESGDIDYDGVPDNVRELAKAYERKNEAMRTSADIRHINDNLRKLNKANDEVILALSYLVYDANGFRRTEPAHPGDIDFYDPGIQKVSEQLERISDKLCDERSYQQGKRKNMYGQKGQV